MIRVRMGFSGGTVARTMDQPQFETVDGPPTWLYCLLL